MKIELSIKSDYFPEWGVWEGLRELVSNGRDAEREFNAPLVVRFRKESDTLVIENEGATLPHEALLLGHTSKRGRAEMIGRFGEGLKGGILALVRAGCPVKIRSGSEVWTPAIQRSEKFDADVLVFEIATGRKPENRVAVEIGNINVESWEKLKGLFLFLGKHDKDQVKTTSGSLLLSAENVGKVFVKGIFVANEPRLSYGYDFADADIDRDRRMLQRWDMNYRTALIWREAMASRPDLVESFGVMLEKTTADVEGIDEYMAGNIPDKARQNLAQAFKTRHGEDALPVGNLSESAEIEHLGKKGIVVPKPLRAVLEKELGNLTSNKEKLREEVTRSYGWHDLDAAEKAHIQSAITLVNPVEQVSLDNVDVTDFRDEGIRGMFKDGRILLAKKILADRDICLRVLVHEVAHRAGGDGEKGHVSNIERIWSGIVKGLLASSLN